ncbi:phosphopyruvate hydratase, partial [Lactobacillus helveticus]|uniref:phosphopyruvate hydratase n=1 Tax=Lactobacillus helveticus TaxID=1587 RepID=UPI00156295E6
MMTVYIEQVRAMEIFDSRGNPTVEVHVYLSDGTVAKAEVPSGASTGEKEAVELRDGGSHLSGKGVTKAVANVNGAINDALKGMSPYNQAKIDRTMIELDGTPNKAKLGANAILGVSMAVARAAAHSKHEPLYRYLGGCDLELPQTFHNVINGGKHADNGIDIQEFMITPVKKTSFRDGFEKIVNTYHTLKKVIEEAGFETGLGDEGGFAPNLKSSEEALKMLHEAIEKAGYKPGEDIAIAFDAAASSFYNKEDGKYHFEGHVWDGDQMLDYYDKLLKEFPEIISAEDPFDENDWNNFEKFTARFGKNIQVVADDNVCTNPKLVRKAIKDKLCNAVLIKVNQIGTITETLETIR